MMMTHTAPEPFNIDDQASTRRFPLHSELSLEVEREIAVKDE